jgi:hypothetical protein
MIVFRSQFFLNPRQLRNPKTNLEQRLRKIHESAKLEMISGKGAIGGDSLRVGLNQFTTCDDDPSLVTNEGVRPVASV